MTFHRTEYKDADIEFVLEDLDVSRFALLPGHAYIRNITDIDIRAPADGALHRPPPRGYRRAPSRYGRLASGIDSRAD